MIATVLNAIPNVRTLGEMHQFLEYCVYDKECACGNDLSRCDKWKSVLENILPNMDVKNSLEYSLQKERHRQIMKYLVLGARDENYLKIHESVLENVEIAMKAEHYVDSSKYIARYLLLRESTKLSLKGLFVVRDVRGVIHSFSKKVQTPRSAFSTIIYYYAINIVGLIISALDRKVIKVRYEDFTNNPEEQLARICQHVFDKKQIELNLQESMEIPHIIGGNRLKTQGSLTIKKDLQWKNNISRPMQIFYYFVTLPLMIINRYKI